MIRKTISAWATLALESFARYLTRFRYHPSVWEALFAHNSVGLRYSLSWSSHWYCL